MLYRLFFELDISISEELKESNLRFNCFNNYISSVNKVKGKLFQDKIYLEVVIGFLQILGAFIGINTFKTPIIYWHILRFRYIINPYVYKSFEDLNQKLNNFKDNTKCPKIIKYTIEKMQMIFNYFGSIKSS